MHPDRAITFDAGGTLLHTEPSPGEIYAEVAARHGLRVPGDRMSAAFRAVWDEIHAEDRFHDDGEEDGMSYWREIVYRTLDRVGGLPDPEPCFLELYDLFADPSVWRLDPDAIDCLDDARVRGLGVALVSNWDRRLRGLLAGFGLLDRFDSVSISCEVGVEKPHPAIFAHALEGLGGISPDRVVHVGDSYRDDVIGAGRSGVDAVLIVQEAGPAPAACRHARSLKAAYCLALTVLDAPFSARDR